MSTQDNFVDMQNEAMKELREVAYQLSSKAGAAYDLGMESLGQTFYCIEKKLVYAITLLKEANDASFTAYVKVVNDGSANMIAAVLANTQAVTEADKGQED